jgi:retinol-binding protein 3
MKKILNIKHFLLVIILLITPALILSQGNITLDKAAIEKTIKKTAKLLNENYVFPDAAKKMGELINNKLSSGGYDGITDPMAFCDTLTADLQSVSKDKHIRVRFNPEELKKMKEAEKSGDDTKLRKQQIENMKKDNFGFRKVERLSGNIGYVDFRMFGEGDVIKETVSGVMEFLSHTDAIIFDIRKNGGGSPDGIRLICSYLFGKQPVHLNDIYMRPNDNTEEFWTLSKVDGEKMPDIPVYVLTSGFTFSGAEEFAYDLKNLKRATIIGEVTGGGANPGGMVPINDWFGVFIPTGRAINPYTKTNWEGTGVQPDVLISSDMAYDKAQVMALEKIISLKKDEQEKKQLLWLKESLEGAMNCPGVSDEILKRYAGNYAERNITYSNGKLYYQRKPRDKFEMTPMSDDTFMFRDIQYFRVKFEKDDSGKVTGLTGIYDDGHTDKSKRQ